MYVVRRLPVQYPGPAHDDQNRSDSRMLTRPTPIRIHPTASMFTPLVVAFTANVRMAPTAIRKIPTPRPIDASFVSQLPGWGHWENGRTPELGSRARARPA